MASRKETFASEFVVKLPQLEPIMRGIEEIDFGIVLSRLSELTLYMFNNTERTNIHLNRLIIYTGFNCVGKTMETKRGFILLFNEWILSSAFSLNRLIFEHWAATCFVEKTIRDFRNNRDEVKLAGIADKLFSGSRYPVNLPWGEKSNEKPIHINEFLGELERHHPETRSAYAFLCEYCHPNFLYNVEAFIASNLPESWHNPKFLESIATVLEKQLVFLEQALSGINANAEAISGMCLEEYGIDLPRLL